MSNNSMGFETGAGLLQGRADPVPDAIEGNSPAEWR